MHNLGVLAVERFGRHDCAALFRRAVDEKTRNDVATSVNRPADTAVGEFGTAAAKLAARDIAGPGYRAAAVKRAAINEQALDYVSAVAQCAADTRTATLETAAFDNSASLHRTALARPGIGGRTAADEIAVLHTSVFDADELKPPLVDKGQVPEDRPLAAALDRYSPSIPTLTIAADYNGAAWAVARIKRYPASATVEEALRVLVPDIVFADLDWRTVRREDDIEVLHQKALPVRRLSNRVEELVPASHRRRHAERVRRQKQRRRKNQTRKKKLALHNVLRGMLSIEENSRRADAGGHVRDGHVETLGDNRVARRAVKPGGGCRRKKSVSTEIRPSRGDNA